MGEAAAVLVDESNAGLLSSNLADLLEKRHCKPPV
jgi:hypothetical protein